MRTTVPIYIIPIVVEKSELFELLKLEYALFKLLIITASDLIQLFAKLFIKVINVFKIY